MPFKVQVGPHQVAIHHGQTVLVSEPDGQINWPSEKGLYFFDTRVISSWTIYANGEPWRPSQWRCDHPLRVTNLSYQSKDSHAGRRRFRSARSGLSSAD